MDDMHNLPHPFADLIGFETSNQGEGVCINELTIEEKHFNPHGIVHGAAIYALADTGMGGALSSLLDEGQICTTIEIKINYLRPATRGHLTCETRVINKGSRTAVLESSVVGEDGKLIARAMATFMIL